jgi:protein phosphatase
MYADHFTIDVSAGDRVLLCSDGLSSMIEDSQIEAIAVSSATPQAAVDNLVGAALQEGGHDNVTVVVIDVSDDGVIEEHRRRRVRWVAAMLAIVVGLFAAVFVAGTLFVRNSWYVGVNGDTVAIYHGINASLLGHDLYALSETSTVQLADLPDAVQQSLREGIVVSGEDEAHRTVESYREQIETERAHAQQVADKSTAGTETSPDSPAVPKGDQEPEGESDGQSSSEQESESNQGGE